MRVFVPKKAETRGIHHFGLTVPNVAETCSFFVEVLGFEKIGENPAYPAAFISDGVIVISLWQAENPVIAFPFDRKNVIGLHHFALAVESERALSALYENFLDIDCVDIEFAPEQLGQGAKKHMMCYIPGGIRVEFIAPAP